MKTDQIVFIVYDHGDGALSRVFDSRKLAEEWINQGHEEGWLYNEDCSIYEEIIYTEDEE